MKTRILSIYITSLAGLILTLNAQDAKPPAVGADAPAMDAVAKQPAEQSKAHKQSGPPEVPTLFKKTPGVPLSPRAAARTNKKLLKYDEDRDGILSPAEDARRMADVHASMQARMAKYDLNGDGKLDEQEMEQYRKDMVGQRLLRESFFGSTSQPTTNAALSPEELARRTEELRAREKVLLEKHDRNGNGMLDPEEWELFQKDLRERKLSPDFFSAKGNAQATTNSPVKPGELPNAKSP